MADRERMAHWLLNWVKRHPEVRRRQWLAFRMIREAEATFPDMEPRQLLEAVHRAKELRRAELDSQ
ncbi:hypothetical protein [Ensifer aridi]|uniref:hypothetical protein n=1 Tax=Ensifer aridi TaxID=1708715 RepID=UPI0011118372|nr:hypothetical protein [Ensifer aridi]